MENSSSNSALSLRSIGLLYLPENYDNVKFAMDTLVDHETEYLKRMQFKANMAGYFVNLYVHNLMPKCPNCCLVLELLDASFALLISNNAMILTLFASGIR